ncbi:DUF805 domain-containing protein [Kribbella sp. NPDC056345]|uniref:DUF805 domain-containing protein n=1 Tax=Kribbella sp. NPDC056345 TaxID=3345789 RepID=UPI0035E0800D
MQWFLAVVKQYAVFSGRARRKEYWMYTLFWAIGYIVLGVVDQILGTHQKNTFGGLLAGLFSLALLLPSIGVAIRRMHDTGRSGWWILINLVPCVGWIWFIVLAAGDGNPGDNQYGPDPKAAERGFGGPAGPAEPGYPTA